MINTDKITKRKRNKIISFRVSEDEKLKLEKKINSTNLKNQDFFLKLIEEKEIFIIPELSKLILELNRIGINLNQISKKLNSEEQIGILKKIDLNKKINKNSEDLNLILKSISEKIK